jgi:glycosyltransferase involved in cell wall biosynthesis
LREALHQLAWDQRMRETFACAGYDRARRMFTADRMVNEYLDLYRSLVDQNKAAEHKARVAGGAETFS